MKPLTEAPELSSQAIEASEAALQMWTRSQMSLAQGHCEAIQQAVTSAKGARAFSNFKLQPQPLPNPR